MLLFALLENRLLDPDRGDVIVFNNTSAEHPDTYRFVHDCMRTARQYGVPFFQVEFQTYEDARKGEWTRLPTYRLVNEEPISSDESRWLPLAGRDVRRAPLLDWVRSQPVQPDLHSALEARGDAQLPEGLAGISAKRFLGSATSGTARGSTRTSPTVATRAIRAAFPRTSSGASARTSGSGHTSVPEQRYDTFLPGVEARSKILRSRARPSGTRLGSGRRWSRIRRVHRPPRETSRTGVQRVGERSDSTLGYEGEHVYMPLSDMAVTRDDVNAFWDRQEWDLTLPKTGGLSNCVFCFLKGLAHLQGIRERMKEEVEREVPGYGPLSNTPV